MRGTKDRTKIKYTLEEIIIWVLLVVFLALMVFNHFF